MSEGPVSAAETALLLVDLQNDFIHPNGAYGRAGQGAAEIAALPARIAPLAQAMRAAWSEFVHTNDPDAPGLPWPPYQRDTRMTMRFDLALGPVGDLAGAAWRGGVG